MEDVFGYQRQEKSACGVGFVVSRKSEYSHEIIKKGLQSLKCVEHRGACAADNITSDGAGIMAEIPFELLGYERGSVAVATLFIDTDPEMQRKLLQIFEDTFSFWGMNIISYRPVPINKAVLGEQALKTMPHILQAIIQRPYYCNTDESFNKLLYTAKQMTLTKQRRLSNDPQFFLPSLSVNTIVYKALTRAEDLERFYPDLQNPKFKSRFSLIHRRFSTNTVTSWDKSQPFRLISHNGEINTIQGNRSWAYSREKSMGLPRNELLTHEGISDSGSLNEMAEALMYRSSLPYIEDALALMIPPSDQKNPFYKFWSRAMEPWDGPALITFSDGETIGARLDRNGFRPCRWAITDDNFYLSSEAGSFVIDETEILAKGSLRAGSGVKIDINTGEIDFKDPSQSKENFNAKFDLRLFKLDYSQIENENYDLDKKYFFNYTDEEFNKILMPMILTAKEPIGSMGDTARLAILSDQPRSFFDYFSQNFAQVTNPPLDYLREKMVTDLTVYLGPRPNIFDKKELIPLPASIELSSPVLSLGQMEYIKNLDKATLSDPVIISKVFDITFRKNYGVVDFRAQIEKISKDVVSAVKNGTAIVIFSDRNSDSENLPIPALLILRVAIAELDKAGLRLKVSIIIDSAQIYTTHHVATSISSGASAICPYLALQIARYEKSKNLDEINPDEKEKNIIKALESGLLKVMSKMGISVVRSYQSSKLFTIVGLDKDLCRQYFRGVPSLIGGLGIEEIVNEILEKAEIAEKYYQSKKLINTYQFREYQQGTIGEKHSMTSPRSKIIHKLVRNTAQDSEAKEIYTEYLESIDSEEPINIRHLLELKSSQNQPIKYDDVQSIEEIMPLFGSGAMSFGAISAESQRDIITAMQEIGGRSNSGEGGENPYYEKDGISASIKQIASARFGVTARYLISAKEFQIKVAQGAKPGEGGQLMAPKVNEDIAKARHSMTNVDLISPPPLHDIYSIEDLKQLIYELKQIKPHTKVSVKLVAGANIGTIAIGVAKAGADIIHISGSDGGTGAASLSSMKHAGLPFEFGLIEVHKALIDNQLRQKITLRVDGGIHTGKDVIMAAIMGADEFDFGKLLLVAQGCIMARVCEKNTCPAGIATHDPKFKAKYKGNKDHIVKILKFIAEDIREHLYKLGVKSIGEIIGRTDLLEINQKYLPLIKKKKLDLSFIISQPLLVSQKEQKEIPGKINYLNNKIIEDSQQVIKNNQSITLDYNINTFDRAILSSLSGVIASIEHNNHLDYLKTGIENNSPFSGNINLNFTGSAGQGFGVFMVDGIKVKLYGEANDSVCKTMSGGKVIIVPNINSNFRAEENVIIGNCALYGATGGTLFVKGQAGDRFAVRNSGATTIVEGTGMHACEYMTNGLVIILGQIGKNLGSGMTGGKIYLFGEQEHKTNNEYIAALPLEDEDFTQLKNLLRTYLTETESKLALEILLDWENNKNNFKKYLPVNVIAKMKANLLV